MNCLLLHEFDARFETALSEHDFKYCPVPVLQITLIPPVSNPNSLQTSDNKDVINDCTRIGVTVSPYGGVNVSPYGGVIVTSKYAVNYIIENGIDLSGKGVAVVGPSTANLLHNYCSEFQGITLVWADSAAKLSDIILANFQTDISWVFFCSAKALETIPRTLRQNGVNLTQIEVYKTDRKPGLESDLTSVLNGGTEFGAVAFFSPSGVEFSAPVLVGKLPRHATLVAFGRSTEAAVTAAFGDVHPVKTCKHPTPSGLVNVLLDIAAQTSMDIAES